MQTILIEQEKMKTADFSRRDFLKLGGISLLGASATLSFGTKVFATPTGTPFGPVRFAVVTDAHVDIKGVNAMKMSAFSSECVAKTVADLNMEKNLDFVMVTGDLLLDGEWENAREIKKHLDRLNVPYYVVAGNHDYMPANPKNRRDGFTYMTIDEFVTFFNGHGYDHSGSRYYARSIKPGMRIIALDACLPDEQVKWGGYIPADQLAWLDAELSGHPHDLNLVFMHHNFVGWSEDETSGGPKQWFNIDNAADVRAVLSKHKKAAPVAISGHRHIGMNHKEIEGVSYFIAPSLNSHPMRYTVFTISNEAIVWKTPMVSVPENLHLQARENLLNAKWWRDTRLEARNSANDRAVLQLYENSDMVTGIKKF